MCIFVFSENKIPQMTNSIFVYVISVSILALCLVSECQTADAHTHKKVSNTVAGGLQDECTSGFGCHKQTGTERERRGLVVQCRWTI